MNLKTSLMCAFIISTAFSSAYAQESKPAETTIRIPVILGDGDNELLKMSLAEANKQLAAKHIEALPSYIEISAKDDAYKLMVAVNEKATAAVAALGYGKYGGLLLQSVPGGMDQEAKVQTCFTGDAIQAVDLFGSVGDVVYSDQMSLEGYKYKTTTFINGNFEGDELAEVLKSFDEGSPAWKSYDQKSDLLLILNSVGDDGTDVNESVIPRCK